MKINFNLKGKSENGSLLFQFLCAVTGTISIISSSMHYGWPTPSLPKLLKNESSHIPITNSEGSWLAVLMLLGCPVGSIVACLTVDILGRKRVILVTALPLIAAWIMIAYATVVEMLYAARFMAGIADGIIFTTIPMYLCEIADAKVRGLLGSSSSVSLILGVLLVNILGIFFDITTSSLISICFPMLFLLTFCWMPESPYFLLMTSREESARNSLRLLKGKTDVETEINRLSEAIKCGANKKGKILDLFRIRSNRKALMIVVGLRTVQQLSGITAITFYAQIIIENVSSFMSSNTLTIIYFLIQSIVTVMSSFLLDKAGRKPLLVISAVGCTISLTMQATYYYLDTQRDLSHVTFIPILSLVLFIVAYCVGMSTIPILMLGELFPTNVKAFALCFAEIYYGLIATVASKFFQIIKDEFNLFIPFYAFAGCCLLGLVFIVQYVPETKGRTLEEIQEHLKGEKTERPNKSSEEDV